ncbi:MAG: hypothetical protein HOG49_06240 [Candidatus Scalindua sp.]|jgi:hypothetical protein|nr:hypothetical protein [Candidatus Scalindua sp.]
MKAHIIVEETTGGRLCKDGFFRTFASFGTYRECVKVYSSEAWARRKQDKLHAQGNDISVVTLADNQSMDAAGHISRIKS